MQAKRVGNGRAAGTRAGNEVDSGAPGTRHGHEDMKRERGARRQSPRTLVRLERIP